MRRRSLKPSSVPVRHGRSPHLSHLSCYAGIVIAGTITSPALAEPVAEGRDGGIDPPANQPRPDNLAVSDQTRRAVALATTSPPESTPQAAGRNSPFQLAKTPQPGALTVKVEVAPNFPQPGTPSPEADTPIASPTADPAPKTTPVQVSNDLPSSAHQPVPRIESSQVGTPENPVQARLQAGSPPWIIAPPLAMSSRSVSDPEPEVRRQAPDLQPEPESSRPQPETFPNPAPKIFSTGSRSPVEISDRDPAPAASAENPQPETISLAAARSPLSEPTRSQTAISLRSVQPVQASELRSNGSAADLGRVSDRTLADLGMGDPNVAEPPETFVPQPKVVPVRGGVRYTDGGYGNEPGYTSFEGLFPIAQEPGKSLTFAEGRVLLQNNSALGNNILLGHREYNAEDDRIYGGYMAYDYRSTERSSFNQLGFGFESLGEAWDVRVNAYLPVGRTRNRFNTFFNNQFRFGGRNLLIGRTEQYEAAAAVLDIEGGGRLADWERGGLRGYLGTYIVGPAGGGSAAGVRGRLELRAADVITLNLGASYDSIFDSQGYVSVGVLLPGVGGSRHYQPAESPDGKYPIAQGKPAGTFSRVVHRLGDLVVRNPAIVVANQTVNVEDVALNPANGQPYIFTQVNLNGTGGGDGTIENPFGLMSDALVAATGQPNSIVYVQPGTNPGIPAFTIPDNVAVISTAFLQTVPVTTRELPQILPAVQLPLSGQGTRPDVNGTVTLGNNTLLDGFNITTTDASGIVASGIGNATVRNTIVTTTGTDTTVPAPAVPAPALQLLNTTGPIAFTNTSLTGVNVPVIAGNGVSDFTFNVAGTTTPITSTNTDGNLGTLTSTSSVTNGLSLENIAGNVVINAGPGSEITNFFENGILLQEGTGAVTLSGFTISSNVVNPAPTNGNEGVRVVNLANSNLNLLNNTINIVQSRGFDLLNVTGDVTVTGNTVNGTIGTNSGFVLQNDAGTVNLVLADNTFNNTGSNGAVVSLTGTAQGTATITNTNASGNATFGLFLQAADDAQLTFNVADSSYTNNGTAPTTGGGISVVALNNAQVNGTLSNVQTLNNINGIGIQAGNDSNLRVLIENSITTGNAQGGLAAASFNNAIANVGVRFTTATGNGVTDVRLVEIAPSTLCVQSEGNTFGVAPVLAGAPDFPGVCGF